MPEVQSESGIRIRSACYERKPVWRPGVAGNGENLLRICAAAVDALQGYRYLQPLCRGLQITRAGICLSFFAGDAPAVQSPVGKPSLSAGPGELDRLHGQAVKGVMLNQTKAFIAGV